METAEDIQKMRVVISSWKMLAEMLLSDINEKEQWMSELVQLMHMSEDGTLHLEMATFEKSSKAYQPMLSMLKWYEANIKTNQDQKRNPDGEA